MIAVVSVVGVLFLRAAEGAGAADEVAVEPISVTCGRQTAMLADGGRVTVIRREEIARLPVSSVADAVALVAGVDARVRGRDGVQADLSVRGGTFEQTLVLINGVKVSDPQSGHLTLDLPIGLGDIERIEVLRGPASRTWGPNAFAGVVNIVTTGAYSRGTSRAIFDGEFAPSSTSKPGVVMQGPFIAGATGDDVLVTTSAAINPLTITIWYYIVT